MASFPGISSFFVALLYLFFFLCSIDPSLANTPKRNISTFNYRNFPKHFVFGASSAAYQYEGAAFEDGKGLNIWDTFTHKYPEKITDRSNGDVADDFYHRYKEDIKLMKFLGLTGFRFSISWARVLPYGKISKGVNRKGIDFYNRLINELLANGITPFVTIFHFDLPQALEDEYKGFLSTRIVDDFRDFADLCFKEFGDRVKHWATVNEPWTFCFGAYDMGTLAPGRCSSWRNNECTGGNSATEPYIVAHNILLSHAAVSKLYRVKYKAYQKGLVGIVLNPNWFEPYSNSKADILSVQRALDFMYGWFLDPLVFGDYPKSMRQLVGKRLPKFTAEQSKLVKGSLDYLGINYYTSNYAADAQFNVGPNVSFTTDNQVNQTTERNGKPIGEPTGIPIFFVYPKGLEKVLVYTKNKYNNPTIYILENGMGEANINSVEQGVKDFQRVRFYQGHLMAVKAAIDKGVKVKGYFAWSFLDTFEWNSGYTQRFGINFVDFRNGLKRYTKLSGLWYKKFLSD